MQPQMNNMNHIGGFNQARMQNPIHQRFSYNPMARIQVQPLMQGNFFRDLFTNFRWTNILEIILKLIENYSSLTGY